MKNNKKTGIFILTIIAILIILVITVVNIVQRNKENYQESEQSIASTELQGFKIENVKYVQNSGSTEIIADVTNKTGDAQKAILIYVVVIDSNGTEVTKIPAIIVDTQEGETVELHATIAQIYEGEYAYKLEKR